MRWKAKPEVDEEKWHKVYAWFPKKIEGKWIWLEPIMRMLSGNSSGDVWWLYASVEDYRQHQTY